MKNFIVCLPMAACATTHAHSSVTLYGAVDAALTYTNKQRDAAAYQASSGGRTGDKLGLSGVEKISERASLVFVLESGFNIENGMQQPVGKVFGRQAYIGLRATWGTVLFGRQYSLTNNCLAALGIDAVAAGALGSTLGDVDGLWNYNKISNAIKISSAELNGWQYTALYSPGDEEGTGHGYGLATSYRHAGLTLAFAHMSMHDPAQSIFGASSLPATGRPYALPVATPAFAHYVTARTHRVTGVGVGYTFGRARINAVYTQVRFQDIVGTAANADAPCQASVRNYQINGAFNLTASVLAGIGYQYSVARLSTYHSLDFGIAYSFSKSTCLYGIAAWQYARGIDSTGTAAVADISGLTPSRDAQQLALRVGLRHLF
jgi:predicted porin